MASQRLPNTSTLAAAWCNRLDQFCTQLQKSCSSLHAIVQRKPEPESRGDNFDTFLEDLNDNVSSALAELQHLEERTTDTLSFEELLVHCDALYKSNEDGISKLELQLQQYGYTPVEAPKQIHAGVVPVPIHQEVETDSQNLDEAISPPGPGALSSINEAAAVTPVALSYETSNVKRDVEYSPLFGDLGDIGSLESLGISATSLTALASQDGPAEGSGSVHPLQHKLTFVESPPKEDFKISLRDAEMEVNLTAKYGGHWTSETEMKPPSLPSKPESTFNSSYGIGERHLRLGDFNRPGSEYDNRPSISTITAFSKKDETGQSLGSENVTFLSEVTSVQYDSSPSWLKSQVSLQELNDLVTRINELVRQRSIGGQHTNQLVLDQQDITALGLGLKSKAVLVLLVKADKLVTQKINGVTTYRICV